MVKTVAGRMGEPIDAICESVMLSTNVYIVLMFVLISTLVREASSCRG